MANDVPLDDRTSVQVKLPPQLEAYLRSLVEKTGRSLGGEIISLIGDAMEAAEVPLAPTNTPFVCTEELMAQKAECQDCGAKILHNAKLWAERHVQETGHNVHVSLFFDLRDDAWRDKISPERRAEIQEVQKPGVGQALAQSLMSKRKH